MTSGSKHMSDGFSRQRGYTLLEMLIVMAIFSLMLGFAVPSLRSSSAAGTVKHAEAVLVSALREARARAVATNQQAGVRLDLTANRLSQGPAFSAADAEILGDQSLQIQLTTARALMAGESDGMIVFFPDGTSSGGRVILQSGSASSVVEVDWMTGLTRISTGDAANAGGGRDG